MNKTTARWPLRVLLCLLIIAVSLMTLLGETLVLGQGGTAVVYAPELFTKLLATALLCTAIMFFGRHLLTSVVVLVITGLFWLSQSQSIITQSDSEPPRVSVLLFSIFEAQTLALCRDGSADDLFVTDNETITAALPKLSLSDLSCQSSATLRYVHIPRLVEFVPVASDTRRRNIATVVDIF